MQNGTFETDLTGAPTWRGYQFMFRARMCRSLIFDRVEDWDERTVHSCAKHKLITHGGRGVWLYGVGYDIQYKYPASISPAEKDYSYYDIFQI